MPNYLSSIYTVIDLKETSDTFPFMNSEDKIKLEI
jgi:hypothetical protein